MLCTWSDLLHDALPKATSAAHIAASLQQALGTLTYTERDADLLLRLPLPLRYHALPATWYQEENGMYRAVIDRLLSSTSNVPNAQELRAALLSTPVIDWVLKHRWAATSHLANKPMQALETYRPSSFRRSTGWWSV